MLNAQGHFCYLADHGLAMGLGGEAIAPRTYLKTCSRTSQDALDPRTKAYSRR
jgi:hypothetical protein